jgi:uncharacterized protein YkwD
MEWKMLSRIGSQVRSRTASEYRVLACLFLVLLLASVSLNPVGGADGDPNPVAIGFIGLDGVTSITESTYDGSAEDSISFGAGSGVPSEPLGHALVHLTNQERTSRGLPPLKAAFELMDSAQFHSDWMADHDCFAHTCSGEPDWVSRIGNAGYSNYSSLGENIAAGYPSSAAVIDAWMDSPGHRANMLSADFREAGGGYAFSGTAYYHHYWTMDFGARTDAQGNPVYPVVINGEGWSTTSLYVDLYVHGQGWATEMRFRNEGGAWSAWQPFSPTKVWKLSTSSGSPATVYAQIRRGSVVLESSDSIYLDVHLSVVPETLVFLLVQGSGSTTPAEYELSIDASGGWVASADQAWIKLSAASGSDEATVTVYLEGFPTSVGTYTGTITVEGQGISVDVAVTLAVTSEALQQSHVPLLTSEQT